MRKTSIWWSGIRIALSIILIGLLILIAVDAWTAWATPQAYPFGTEGPSAAQWMYRSQAHYLAAACISMLATAAAIVGLLPDRLPSTGRYICLTPAAVVVVWRLYDAFLP